MSRHPWSKVQSEATRFPLSTEEMKKGGFGSRVRVSYQFMRWPRYLGRRSMVPIVFCVSSTNSGTVI